MTFCYYCDIFAFVVAAWLLNCFLIFWHLGLLGNTDRNHYGVIMNQCAVSQRRISPPLTYFCITHKHALPHFDCYSYIFRTLLLLSLSACCLFIRQTICWRCVFFLRMPFPWHAASHGGALPIIWCVREAQREPLPATQRWSLCVFAPGSLSARGKIIGRAGESLLFSSPHYSFGKLISSFLWPAIIYIPYYFMAHFRISTSLYVQADLHLQECLCCVIGILLLCSAPCKTLRRELCAVVIKLFLRFIVWHLDSFVSEEMSWNLMGTKWNLSTFVKLTCLLTLIEFLIKSKYKQRLDAVLQPEFTVGL